MHEVKLARGAESRGYAHSYERRLRTQRRDEGERSQSDTTKVNEAKTRDEGGISVNCFVSSSSAASSCSRASPTWRRPATSSLRRPWPALSPSTLRRKWTSATAKKQCCLPPKTTMPPHSQTRKEDEGTRTRNLKKDQRGSRSMLRGDNEGKRN